MLCKIIKAAVIILSDFHPESNGHDLTVFRFVVRRWLKKEGVFCLCMVMTATTMMMKMMMESRILRHTAKPLFCNPYPRGYDRGRNDSNDCFLKLVLATMVYYTPNTGSN